MEDLDLTILTVEMVFATKVRLAQLAPVIAENVAIAEMENATTKKLVQLVPKTAEFVFIVEMELVTTGRLKQLAPVIARARIRKMTVVIHSWRN
jgi:hypothetical protein